MAPHADNNGSAESAEASQLDFTSFRQYINGVSVKTATSRHGINPATKEDLWDVPVSGEQHMNDAVDAAKAAFKTWKNVPLEQRKKAILAYADAVDLHHRSFSTLLTTEQGKPKWQADFETTAGAEWMRGIAGLEVPEDVVEETEKRKIVVRYTPLGVVGAIVPWNFPLLLATAKIAPAVLMGNTVIVKPSPFAPYCGLKLVELAQKFFPPGVVQSVSGGDDIGPMMTSHPGIDKISFTGSTATGKLVMRSCSASLKRVVLELGGNDPAIICKDVNIAKVAPQIATFAFLNSGQVCLNMKRIYVHEDIYEEFLAAVVAHLRTMKVGNGSEEGVMLGPLQNSMQYDRVRTFFDDIPKEKWKVATGGKFNGGSTGYYIEPTIIDNPPDDSRIVVEEPFGPIVPTLSWKTEEEVISRANDTRMGLGASVWSSNLDTAERIAQQIEAGTVWINNHFDLSPRAPFGGHKESGIGSEWGVNGLKAMCNVQSIFYNKDAGD